VYLLLAADVVGTWLPELFAALLQLLALLATPDLPSRGDTVVRDEVLLQETRGIKRALLRRCVQLINSAEHA
jgi:hypothetical protein